MSIKCGIRLNEDQTVYLSISLTFLILSSFSLRTCTTCRCSSISLWRASNEVSPVRGSRGSTDLKDISSSFRRCSSFSSFNLTMQQNDFVFKENPFNFLHHKCIYLQFVWKKTVWSIWLVTNYHWICKKESYMTWNLLSYCNDKVFQENHLLNTGWKK